MVVQLGEVDSGFVIWYREKEKGLRVDEGLRKATQEYLEFLSKLRNKYKDVIVISSPLPTIKDGVISGEVANLRKEITASQMERTKLSLRFNKTIKDKVECMEGVHFLDLDPVSYDSKRGLVAEFLLRKDDFDHHYDESSYLKTIQPKLEILLNSIYRV